MKPCTHDWGAVGWDPDRWWLSQWKPVLSGDDEEPDILWESWHCLGPLRPLHPVSNLGGIRISQVSVYAQFGQKGTQFYKVRWVIHLFLAQRLQWVLWILVFQTIPSFFNHPSVTPWTPWTPWSHRHFPKPKTAWPRSGAGHRRLS